jgi:hypothetical protein
MKAFAILPAAVAAILAFNSSAAFSQAGCQKEYQACMDGCTGRSSKGMQDSCFTSCESKNNMCAERVYGKRPFNGAPANANAAAPRAPKDALAKDAAATPEPAAEKEPAQPPAAEREQAPAPAPAARAPARRQAR